MLPNCGSTRSGDKQAFKRKAIEKLIVLAREREHNKFISELVASLDNVEPSVELNKACYCAYTSKKYTRKSVAGTCTRRRASFYSCP